MASVSMTVKVEEDVAEGLFKGIPLGLHRVTIPSVKLAFIDTKGGSYTLGGTFTTEQNIQLIKNNTVIDGCTVTDINLIGD